jgi:hypothetical protein
MITCSWCNTSFQTFQPSCENCGGPLPPPPGEDPGPTPPSPPRTLPESYVFRVKYTRNVMFIVGAAFAAIGGTLGLVFTGVGAGTGDLGFLGIGLGVLVTFGGLGSFAARFALRSATNKINALERGRAILGKVTNVYYDTSVKINGRSPWAIEYSFEVEGHGFQGKVQSWDGMAADRKPGQPVHVVYIEQEPDQNAIYPPVA